METYKNSFTFFYLLLFEFHICRYSVRTALSWQIHDEDAKSLTA